MGFISQIDFSFALLSKLVFAIIALLALIMSLVLFFHWRRYGMGGIVLGITETVYLVVTVLLLGSAFFSLQ